MKSLSIIFGTAVVGVVVCFVMSIVTAVQTKKVETAPTTTQSIPLPAE
jgi:hypothetical protein